MKKYNSEIEKTADILKKLISKNGYNYIYESAYTVYKTLLIKIRLTAFSRVNLKIIAHATITTLQLSRT